MMTSPARSPRLSFAEYLALERESESRHEFFDGVVFAMAGGSPAHAQLAANAIIALGVQLRGRPCRVHSSDLRVRVRATGLATHPDVTVVCGTIHTDPEDRNTVTNPAVIVEVLSDSTERYDRIEKFAHYRQIAELTDYLLVSQREVRVEHYHRNDDGSWTLREFRAGEAAGLAGIGCRLGRSRERKVP